MNASTGEAAKTVQQIIAILGAIGILSMIVHKGYADISLLAQQHAGERFWWALAKYFIGNLAGG